MIQDKQFFAISSQGLVSYISFNRASIDFVKSSRTWLYHSIKTRKFAFLKPKRAVSIIKLMRG